MIYSILISDVFDRKYIFDINDSQSLSYERNDRLKKINPERKLER